MDVMSKSLHLEKFNIFLVVLMEGAFSSYPGAEYLFIPDPHRTAVEAADDEAGLLLLDP